MIDNIKVSVCIPAYNNDKYISQTIESALFQQTNFNFEIIIGEDQSSDFTRDIVLSYLEKYPNKIKVLLRTYPSDYIRVNGRINFVNNILNARGEYIALLDGDDYWTDPLKLQKQVEFLDTHPGYSLVFHWVDWLEKDTINLKAFGPPAIKSSYTVDDLMEHSNFIPPCSVMFRRSSLKEFPEWYFQCPYGDLPLFVMNALQGDIGLIDQSMAVYRIHGGNIYTSKSQIYKNISNLCAHELIASNLDLLDSPGYLKYVGAKMYEIRTLILEKTILKESEAIADLMASTCPNLLHLSTIQADIKLELGDFGSAGRILEKFVDHPRCDPENLFKLAIIELQRHNRFKAQQYLGEVLKRVPNHLEANRYFMFMRNSDSSSVIASVIICTYNRCDLLAASIKSIQAQQFPSELFEIIIVDNNSTDHTRELVENLSNSSPVAIRYVFEERQGLSYARNAAIDFSNGKIILFTDDDIEADPCWVKEIVTAFDDPKVACAGGPIRPIWPFEKPSWINTVWLTEPLSISEFVAAKETGYFSGHYPFGANIAFRKEVCKKFGGFTVTLGRQAGNLMSNEEIELCQKIEAQGDVIRFTPKAVVHHKIAPERLTKQWFYHRFYWQGRSDALLDANLGKRRKERLQKIVPQLLELRRRARILSFSDRCFYSLYKGYLHQYIFSRVCNENVVHWKNIRSLDVFLELLVTTYISSFQEDMLLQKDERIKALTTSLSWRITSPLRAIKRNLDRLFQ